MPFSNGTIMVFKAMAGHTARMTASKGWVISLAKIN